MDWVNRLQEPKFWLLSIAATLVFLHLTLLSRADNSELFVVSVLFWLVAGTLIWERQRRLVWQSDILSTLLGIVLLLLLLLRSAALPEVNSFLRGFPLTAMLGWCLIASGWQTLHHYWKELLIFTLLFVQPVFELILKLINLPLLTAMAANFMLWYTGSDVYREGAFLQLSPDRAVQVYEGCAGAHSILQMLNISVLLLMMVPLRSIGQRCFCLVLAVALGFMVNSVRVALMAKLVGQDAFEYWHTGNGSLVFSMITVLLFGCICWLVFFRSPKVNAGTQPHD